MHDSQKNDDVDRNLSYSFFPALLGSIGQKSVLFIWEFSPYMALLIYLVSSFFFNFFFLPQLFCFSLESKIFSSTSPYSSSLSSSFLSTESDNSISTSTSAKRASDVNARVRSGFASLASRCQSTVSILHLRRVSQLISSNKFITRDLWQYLFAVCHPLCSDRETKIFKDATSMDCTLKWNENQILAVRRPIQGCSWKFVVRWRWKSNFYK